MKCLYRNIRLYTILPFAFTLRTEKANFPSMTTSTTSRRAAPKPAAPKRPKAAVLAAAELRHQIVTGQLKPGDKLHPEKVLQVEFAISRPTLREALRLLEAESLITISRGKHGGARVTSIDLTSVSNQVGIFLQMERTTLKDVWFARTIIEPPAVGMLAALRNPAVMDELDANIAAAREALQTDLILYADLTAEFSKLVTRHCGNQTIHLLSSLIYDIIRLQHQHITARTSMRASVGKLRENSLRHREKTVALIRSGKAAAAEKFWRAHLEETRDLILMAYKGPVTIDVLNEPVGERRAIDQFRRHVLPSA